MELPIDELLLLFLVPDNAVIAHATQVLNARSAAPGEDDLLYSFLFSNNSIDLLLIVCLYCFLLKIELIASFQCRWMLSLNEIVQA